METAHLSLNAAQQQRSAVDGDGELYENNSSQANDADSADLGTASTG